MNTFLFEFSRGDQVLRGILADRPAHVSCGELADELYNSRRSDLTVVNLLVIRHPVDAPLPANVGSEMEPVVERVPHLPLYLLGSVNFVHHLTSNLNQNVASILTVDENNALMKSIRQAELLHYVNDSNAILKATGPRVFRAPSGKFCRTFLRVGNVQKNRDAIDGFFFWILPWLRDCNAIVCETWTISTIAMNAARLLARYSPSTHARVEVEMLSQYHERGSKMQNTESILRRAISSHEANALVLVSSSMSGRLITGLAQTIQDISLPSHRFRFGALYLLGQPNNIPHLCDLSNGVNGATFNSFDMPPSDAGESPAIIEIDRQTYFPLRVECLSVSIRKRTASQAVEVMNAYRDSGLFSVHRDSFLSNGQRHRHHAIYADVKQIVEHQRFRARLLETVSSLQECPSVIICPPHAAGEALARKVQSLVETQFDKQVGIMSHLDLQLQHDNEYDQRLRRVLTATLETDNIVVVDDVSVTGGRLSRFQTSLRQLEFKGRIHYIVGIARPSKETDWKQRVVQLSFRNKPPQHTVHHVEFVVLPDWQEQECPWCQEQEFIRLLARERRASPAFVSRGHRLQSAIRQTPMTNDVFFTPEGTSPLRLTKNSILVDAPASEADVFCAVASAIQTMRTTEISITPVKTQALAKLRAKILSWWGAFRPGNPESRVSAMQSLVCHFPEIHVLDPHCSLGTHFNDSIIRAAVLRAAKARELEYPDGENEKVRRQLTAAIVKDPGKDVHNLSFELGVAMALHKLPLAFSEEGVADIVRQRGWQDTFSGFEAIATCRVTA